MSNYVKVRDFHKLFDLSVGNISNPKIQDAKLRIKLMKEEFDELIEAIGYKIVHDEFGNYEIKENVYPKCNREQLNDIAKELSDLLYVTYGTGVSFGIDCDEIFRKVHESNLSKLGEDMKPIRREDGKVLKGPNYKPANIDVWWLYDMQLNKGE